MPDEGFGSDLWKNVQAIKLGQDGGIEAPVRANDRDGVVVGLDHVASADATATDTSTTDDSTPATPARRWWTRLLRH
jgi:hypothetical protein